MSAFFNPPARFRRMNPKPEELQPAVTPEAAAPQPTVTKAEAVRRAMADGVETPADGVEYVKARFGIEMDAKMFSLNRSQQRAREAKKAGEPKGTPGRKPASPASPAPAAAVAAPKPSGDIIADIEAVRSLIDKHGTDGLKRLVDALG